MKDPNFIDTILQRGNEAKEKVNSAFSSISETQLNWKPAPDSWSVAQCLQHLLISHLAYFPVLKQITEGSYTMGFWEKHSPFTGIWGRAMKNQLQEQVRRKMKAPGKIRPTKSEFRLAILDRYMENLEEFLDLISQCRNIDIDETIITSPILSIVTYNLRDAFQFLIQHEHRHINQATRVKANHEFPGNSNLVES